MKTTIERRISKREESNKEYIDALQDRYSKLNVVRVDLSYKKPYSNDITLDEANKHFSRMLNNRRGNSIFNDNVGYVCKKEFTEDKGVHFHTVFFYNGQKVKNDVKKAIDIGKYWKETITAEKGIYHNCNIDADKKYGDKNAVGMLEHSDRDRRKKLDDAIWYLCKENHQDITPIKNSSKDRVFVRGTIPKKKSKAGRPRSDKKDS